MLAWWDFNNSHSRKQKRTLESNTGLFFAVNSVREIIIKKTCCIQLQLDRSVRSLALFLQASAHFLYFSYSLINAIHIKRWVSQNVLDEDWGFFLVIETTKRFQRSLWIAVSAKYCKCNKKLFKQGKSINLHTLKQNAQDMSIFYEITGFSRTPKSLM